MKIPRIIHQTWKDNNIPDKWKAYQQKVKQLHPDWEYKLWTDADNDAFVKQYFPDFYDTYNGFSKNIMRADVIRYLIMYQQGGMYLDLDYEMLRTFDFNNEVLVLPQNRSISYGDKENTLGNCFFASVPQHPFWKAVIDDLKNNPPVISNYDEVIDATGPMLLTKIYNKGNFNDIVTPERIVFHPKSPKNEKEYRSLVNNGKTYGIHHGWGSWKERFTLFHFTKKLKKIFSPK
jgi:mannosyltransferase OCH1-like enzyme